MTPLPRNSDPALADDDARSAREALERDRRQYLQGPVIAFKWSADAAYTLEYVSPNVSRLGYTTGDFMDGRVSYLEIIHPDDRCRVLEEVAAYTRAGRTCYEQEYRIFTAGREERRVRDFTVVHRSAEGAAVHYDGYVIDVTDLRRAEETLRMTRFCLDQAADAVFWADESGHLVYANRAASELLGYTREQFRELVVADLDPSRPHEAWPMRWKMIREVRTFSWTGFLNTRTGETLPVEITLNFMDLEGQPRICAFARDIRERERAAEERCRLEAQLRQAQKLESLGVLSGGIAHDFNNILSAILGHADLAREELPDGSPVRENLEEIARAARRAADLCRQLLAYSGRGRLEIRPLDLGRLVDEMEHMLRVSVSKKAALQLRRGENLPAVEADAAQIRQVVMNLVINGSEAIGDDSGLVTVTTSLVAGGGALPAGGWLPGPVGETPGVLLEVADTGPGMDRHTLGRIFDPFFTTKFTGRGLGLSTVLGIVRGHGGAIRTDSEPGKGTVFQVFFPASSRLPETEQPEPVSRFPVSGRGTVLLVDDEQPVRDMARRMLERLGLTVLTARDGREALEIFRLHASEIDGVLLDLTMPEMDGSEVFRELRKLRPGVKIILTSGYGEDEFSRRFSGSESVGFLEKPYTFRALSEKLLGMLGEGLSPPLGADSVE